MIELKFRTEIDKPIEDVWKVLFTNFTKVGDWVTGVYHSRPGKEGENADRVCKTFTGTLVERILSKDEENHEFRVDAKGLPFFVKSFQGGWKLNEISKSKTEAVFSGRIKTMPIIGTIMEMPMRKQFKKAFAITMQELKSYVETGEISARKEQEIAKRNG